MRPWRGSSVDLCGLLQVSWARARLHSTASGAAAILMAMQVVVVV